MESRAGPHFQELLFLSLSNKKKSPAGDPMKTAEGFWLEACGGWCAP
jgi:hypothetical protein